MELSRFQSDILSVLRGQFSPDQFAARLFMCHEDIATPENYLVWFHERFHYLQSIFTPYGHLKWGAYRTITSDIITAWLKLPGVFNCARKVPIAEYIRDKTFEGVKIASSIWFQSAVYQLYNVIEQDNVSADLVQMLPSFSKEVICPEIELLGGKYRFRGLDIFESYAKFEEAMMAELLTGKSLDESIDASRLNPEYYSALYYFVSEVGPERLKEFPVACELALATSHIPSPATLEQFYDNAPNWRFIKIVNVLKNSSDLPAINFNNDKSFYVYANAVLSRCGYSTLDGIWDSAEAYAEQTDLSMALEMKAAITYKKSHPWMLSYPMCNPEFMSTEFNRFEPYYTITEDTVMYNTANILPSELVFENNFQALAAQICGRVSPYCLDRGKLMCGDAYMGIKTCPHYLSGECDGHIDSESELPETQLGENGDIERGCILELTLNVMGLSIKDINIGQIRPLDYDQVIEAAQVVERPK